MAAPARREIRRIEDEDSGWSALDEELGVASCGDPREEALEMLDEGMALHNGEIDRPVTDEDLEEWGIDPYGVPDNAPVPDAP